jgi:hypothetical protein
MKLGNMNVIVNTTTTKNVWTYHYNQPPNSTLGRLHMTQTTHELLNGQIQLKTQHNGHVVGGNGGLGFFCSKCFQAWLKNFHSTFQTLCQNLTLMINTNMTSNHI